MAHTECAELLSDAIASAKRPAPMACKAAGRWMPIKPGRGSGDEVVDIANVARNLDAIHNAGHIAILAASRQVAEFGNYT